VAVALAAAAALAAPVAASATEATSGEVRALAERGGSDAEALAELRQVDTVDGRPVDIRALLGSAGGEDLRSRLRTLAASLTGSGDASSEAADASAQAGEILDQRRYRPASVPRPFAGVIEELGEALAPVGRAARRVVDRVDGALPGGAGVAWIALSLLVLGGAVAVANRTVSRRVKAGAAAVRRGRGPREESPGALERRADAAEREGDLKLAMRLRFRAGLLRLDEAGLIAYRPSVRSGDLRRQLGSETFDGLATGFDEVRYGHRAVTEDDLRSARAGWPRVADEARDR